MERLSQKTITELKKIVQDDYGISLSSENARELASGLVSYFDLLAQLNHRIKNDTRDVSFCHEDTSGVSSEISVNTGGIG